MRDIARDIAAPCWGVARPPVARGDRCQSPALLSPLFLSQSPWPLATRGRRAPAYPSPKGTARGSARRARVQAGRERRRRRRRRAKLWRRRWRGGGAGGRSWFRKRVASGSGAGGGFWWFRRLRPGRRRRRQCLRARCGRLLGPDDAGAGRAAEVGRRMHQEPRGRRSPTCV